VPRPRRRPRGAAAVLNFSFYKIDPAIRRLGEHEKIQARSEFLKLFETRAPV